MQNPLFSEYFIFKVFSNEFYPAISNLWLTKSNYLIPTIITSQGSSLHIQAAMISTFYTPVLLTE